MKYTMKAECNVSFSLVTISELYSFLSIRIIKIVISSSAQLISNFGKLFLQTKSCDTDGMLPFTGLLRPSPF